MRANRAPAGLRCAAGAAAGGPGTWQPRSGGQHSRCSTAGGLQQEHPAAAAWLGDGGRPAANPIRAAVGLQGPKQRHCHSCSAAGSQPRHLRMAHRAILSAARAARVESAVALVQSRWPQVVYASLPTRSRCRGRGACIRWVLEFLMFAHVFKPACSACMQPHTLPEIRQTTPFAPRSLCRSVCSCQGGQRPGNRHADHL